MPAPRVYVSTSVSPEQYDLLVQAAAKDGKPVATWVRLLILAALDAAA